MAETAELRSPVSGVAGAVGPGHVLSMQETELHIQSKSGTSFRRQTLDSWWQGLNPAFATAEVSQPRVVYEPAARRWIALVAARIVPASSYDPVPQALLLAVSEGSDPTGLWRSWRFDLPTIGSSTFSPSIQSVTLGFNKHWIAVGMFLLDTHHRSSVHRTLVFTKATAIAGGGLDYRVFEDDASTSITPAQTYDETEESLYLAQSWNGQAAGGGRLRILKIHGAPGQESLSVVGFPTGPAWAGLDRAPDSFFGNAPQLGGAALIATYDDRVQSVVKRHGALWVAHSVFLPASNPTRAAVQWWRIDPATAAVGQRGLIDDASGARFHAFPSLAVNAANKVLVAYNAFAADAHAGAFARVLNPVGDSHLPGPEFTVKAGEALFLKDVRANPWGPSGVACLDPEQPDDFWALQQYAGPLIESASTWGTWWGAVTPPQVAWMSPLGAWREFHGLAADGSQDLTSPGGDGVPNLMKYALNLAPSSGDLERSGSLPLANPDGTTVEELSGLPVVRIASGNRLVFTYLRRKLRGGSGIVYETLFSDDVAAWALNPAAIESVKSIDSTWERVTVTDSASAAGRVRRFARLRVTPNPEFEGGL